MERIVIEPSRTGNPVMERCAGVRRWMREAYSSNDLIPPSPALIGHVEHCNICQGVLLVLIVEVSELPAAMSNTTCQQCLDDLPAYIEQELEDAMSALQAYPHVWWHLLSCGTCAETYLFTGALTKAERSGQLAPLQLADVPALLLVSPDGPNLIIGISLDQAG